MTGGSGNNITVLEHIFRFEPKVFDVEIHTMMTGNVELKAPADVVNSPLVVKFAACSLIRITTSFSCFARLDYRHFRGIQGKFSI